MRLRLRAPWRWRWGLIVLTASKAGAWWFLIQWSPVCAIGCSLWVAIQIRAGYNEPLPSPTAAPLPNDLTSYRVEKRYNGAQTTLHPPVTLRHEV